MLMGVSPCISHEIKLQTHSLSFSYLLVPSSKAGLQTLSSHLVTIWQGLIVGDGDWVSKQGVCERSAEEFLAQCICACWLAALLVSCSRETVVSSV